VFSVCLLRSRPLVLVDEAVSRPDKVGDIFDKPQEIHSKTRLTRPAYIIQVNRK
jgi:hypothetical protein